MKKKFILLMTVAMIGVLVGCSNSKVDDVDVQGNNKETIQSESNEEEQEEIKKIKEGAEQEIETTKEIEIGDEAQGEKIEIVD